MYPGNPTEGGDAGTLLAINQNAQMIHPLQPTTPWATSVYATENKPPGSRVAEDENFASLDY